MVRFEEVLAEHLSRPLQRHELCALVAVSDHTLRAAGCATPIRTTQTSQKLPTASVSLSWSASARLTKRHLARPHRPLSNAFPECDSRLREFSPFLHSWRENPRLSLALAKAMWSEAKAGNIPLPARDAGDPRREIHEARKRSSERGRAGRSSHRFVFLTYPILLAWGNAISLRWGLPSKEKYDAMRMRPTISISFACLVTLPGATSNRRPATDASMQGPHYEPWSPETV